MQFLNNALCSIISFLKSQILHGKSGMLLQLTLPAQGGFRFHDTEKPQKQLSQPSRVTEPIPAPRRRQTAPTIELPPPPIHVTEEKRRSASQVCGKLKALKICFNRILLARTSCKTHHHHFHQPRPQLIF